MWDTGAHETSSHTHTYTHGVCSHPTLPSLFLAVLGEEGKGHAGHDKDGDEKKPHEDGVASDLVGDVLCCHLNLDHHLVGEIHTH